MKKDLKCKINRYLSGGGLTTLAFFSCLTVGYSSWSSKTDIAEGIITSEIGNVTKFDYKSCANYISNSETSFEYYSYEGNYYFTKSTITIDFKVNPQYFASRFLEEDVYAIFGISYISSIDENYFDGSNPNILPPDVFRCHLKGKYTNFIESSALQYTKSINQNEYTYKLSSSVCLYSSKYLSVSNLAKYYQKNSEYIDVTIEFEFNITNGVAISENFLNTTFSVFTSLEA